MDSNKKYKKNKILPVLRKYAPRLGAFALAVVLMAFLMYHMVGLEQVVAETVTAVRAVEYEIAELEGYVFRDEQVLYSQNGGAAVYLVEDGERVSAETELARVYTLGNTEDYLSLRRPIERRISLLEQAVTLGRPTGGGRDATEQARSESYSEFMAALGRGDLSGALEASEQLYVAMCARELAGGDDWARSELARLRAEIAALESSYGGEYQSIYNDRGCYFFYNCDGYEDAFDVSLLSSLDSRGLKELAAGKPSFSGEGTAVGKLVHSHTWYLAATAVAQVCERLEEGASYEITLEDGPVLDMTLERLSLPDKGDGILVFSCSSMPEGFDYGRAHTARLLVDEISGYRVPEQALATQRGFDGVYVLSASQVVFKRVNILYRGSGYAVVAERDLSTENYGEFLNLNDSIIISLSDGELYDGRVLD